MKGSREKGKLLIRSENNIGDSLSFSRLWPPSRMI